MSLLEVKQTSRGSASAGRTIKPRSLIALPGDPTIGLTQWADAMGYNRRNDEIRDNIERMRRDREAYADALATVEQFNARLSAKKSAWFWPTHFLMLTGSIALQSTRSAAAFSLI
jgi:hypothetical protein